MALIKIKNEIIDSDFKNHITIDNDTQALVSLSIVDKFCAIKCIIFNYKDYTFDKNINIQNLYISSLDEILNFNDLLDLNLFKSEYILTFDNNKNIDLDYMKKLAYYNNIPGFKNLSLDDRKKVLKGEQVGPYLCLNDNKSVNLNINNNIMGVVKYHPASSTESKIYNILQFYYKFNDRIKYRKQRFNEYLHTLKNVNFYSNRYCYDDTFDYSKIDIAIISYAYYYIGILSALRDDCWIHYDRTDFWSANPLMKSNEEILFQKANSISCSSQYLYDTLPDYAKKKAFIVENAANIDKFKFADKKKDKKTAIYAGFSYDKINWNQIKTLAEKNLDWDIEIFIKEYNKLELSEEMKNLPSNITIRSIIPYQKLMTEMSSCHVGLIPLKDDDWEKGMFSLKYFDYVKAHIPAMCWDMTNYHNYEQTAFDASKYSLDDLYNMNIDDSVYQSIYNNNQWKSRFDIIMQHIYKGLKNE